MANINFSYNWNKKLDCSAFTTIRLYQPHKYSIGEEYTITMKEKMLFTAIIIDIKKFYLKDLNNFISYLDTGYSKENCTGIILKMYPKINFTNTYVSLILLHKLKPDS